MKKLYKFDYGNFFKFILSKLLELFYDFFTLLILLIPLGVLYGYCENAFSNNEYAKRIIVLLLVLNLIIIVLFLLVCFLMPKTLVLYDDIMVINRYSIDYSYITRGIKDEILISSIVYCEIYDGKRPLFWRARPYAIPFFNWNNLVEIRTKGKRIFLIPIKNAENFVREVNERVDLAIQKKNSNIKEQ